MGKQSKNGETKRDNVSNRKKGKSQGGRGIPNSNKMIMNRWETHKLRDEEHVGNGGEDPATCGQNITGGGGSHSPKHCVCVCVCVCLISSRMRCVTCFNLLFKGRLSLPPPSSTPPTHPFFCSKLPVWQVLAAFVCAAGWCLWPVCVCACVFKCAFFMCLCVPSYVNSACVCRYKWQRSSLHAHKKVLVRRLMQRSRGVSGKRHSLWLTNKSIDPVT